MNAWVVWEKTTFSTLYLFILRFLTFKMLAWFSIYLYFLLKYVFINNIYKVHNANYISIYHLNTNIISE